MSDRMDLRARLAAGAALLLFGCSPDTPPNVILIVADDLGYGDVSAYGSSLETPHIDKLGREGVRFTDAYVTSAVCRPSRVGLLTGRYPQRQGADSGPAARSGLGSPTLAEVLQEQGYATGFVGKWHVGTRRGERPLDRGFDEFFGFLERSLYADPDRSDVSSWEARTAPREQPMPIFRGDERVDEPAYLTDALTREAVAFIEARRDDPFLLVLSHSAPHVPLQATEPYMTRQEGRAPGPKRIYAAMVTALDDGVGAVLDTLDRLGIGERTLVVFLSDNGCPVDGESGCSNGPFSGGKRDLLEGGVRVPFLMRWPARVAAGEAYTRPVSSLDVFATAVAAARAPEQGPPLDGIDLVPYLQDPTRSPQRALHWRVGPNWAVREGRWKLSRYNRPSDGAHPSSGDGALWPRSDTVSLAPRRPVTLLFDLERDPAEQRDLSDRHPDVVQDLEGLHGDWARQLPPPALLRARATLRQVAGLWVEMIF